LRHSSGPGSPKLPWTWLSCRCRVFSAMRFCRRGAGFTGHVNKVLHRRSRTSATTDGTSQPELAKRKRHQPQRVFSLLCCFVFTEGILVGFCPVDLALERICAFEMTPAWPAPVSVQRECFESKFSILSYRSKLRTPPPDRPGPGLTYQITGSDRAQFHPAACGVLSGCNLLRAPHRPGQARPG
jgi:hypothetical protein